MRPDWEIKTIGEVCEIYNGGTPSTSIPEYWDGGIQWITPKDMGKSKKMYVSYCERTISQEGVEHSSTKVLPERSVIVSSRAPIGYVAINDVPMATNQGCKGFVLGKELYPEFLYYFLLASTELLNKLGTGATFKEVSGKKLAGIEIPVPSITEQQRIVDILDQEFAKIDALKANAEKALQAAKDLFQETLHHYYSGKNALLGDVLNLRRGHDLTHSEMKDGSIPVAGSGGIIGYHSIATPISPCIAVGRSGSVGKVFVYETCWAHNTILYVDDFKGNNPYYLVYLLKSLNLTSYGGGSAVPTLNRNVLHPLPVGYTSNKKEQATIVACLDNFNDKCQSLQDNYQRTLSLCDDLKQALLRKAFNREL